MRKWLILLSFLTIRPTFGQSPPIAGKILDISTNQPLEGVTVYLLPDNMLSATNASGNFSIRSSDNISGILVSAIGYESKKISIEEFHQKKNIISLNPAAIELGSVTVSARPGDQFQAIGKIDIKLQDV